MQVLLNHVLFILRQADRLFEYEVLQTARFGSLWLPVQMIRCPVQCEVDSDEAGERWWATCLLSGADARLHIAVLLTI